MSSVPAEQASAIPESVVLDSAASAAAAPATAMTNDAFHGALLQIVERSEGVMPPDLNAAMRLPRTGDLAFALDAYRLLEGDKDDVRAAMADVVRVRQQQILS
ncbi:MAG: hypothetical protein PHW10_04140 [Candidatus Peribacteraceae bacterium]|nr:hypothetical protein [Candidatus Peribacteraceae bacterium]